ncbi:MAG: hemerythrin domain-containing protein [Actinomycetota bacterium]|nr:hemerythrin domain-containing protein [Actinomycetota bacterium]
MDALDFIQQDHDRFRALLDRYEEIDPDDHATKQEVIDELIAAVVRHSAMEEEAFYPVVMREVPQAEDDIREEIEEHHVIEVVMAELDDLDATHEQFDAKVEVLAENLLHHLYEEEDELFPRVRSAFDDDALARLLDALRTAKQRAPSRPDPDRVGG